MDRSTHKIAAPSARVRCKVLKCVATGARSSWAAAGATTRANLPFARLAAVTGFSAAAGVQRAGPAAAAADGHASSAAAGTAMAGSAAAGSGVGGDNGGAAVATAASYPSAGIPASNPWVGSSSDPAGQGPVSLHAEAASPATASAAAACSAGSAAFVEPWPEQLWAQGTSSAIAAAPASALLFAPSGLVACLHAASSRSSRSCRRRGCRRRSAAEAFLLATHEEHFCCCC